MLVEARQDSRAEMSWHYAVARLHCAELTVKLDGTVVAKFPYMRDRKFDPLGPYGVAKWPEQRRVGEAAEGVDINLESKEQERQD